MKRRLLMASAWLILGIGLALFPLLPGEQELPTVFYVAVGCSMCAVGFACLASNRVHNWLYDQSRFGRR